MIGRGARGALELGETVTVRVVGPACTVRVAATGAVAWPVARLRELGEVEGRAPGVGAAGEVVAGRGVLPGRLGAGT